MKLNELLVSTTGSNTKCKDEKEKILVNLSNFKKLNSEIIEKNDLSKSKAIKIKEENLKKTNEIESLKREIKILKGIRKIKVPREFENSNFKGI